MTLDLASFPVTTPVAEAEQFTKPGTANVSPGDLKKLSPLIKKYAAEAKPFTTCKRDQMKHGLSEDHANRRCAVLMDLGAKPAGWRSREEAAADIGWSREQLEAFVAEAKAELRVITAAAGADTVAIAVTHGVQEGLEDADRELMELAEESAAVVEVFGSLPERIGEAYNPPSWTIPKQARRPGFKPVNPPDKKSSSSSSKYDPQKHPRDQLGQFLQKGHTGPAVKGVQQKLGIKTTGTFDQATIKRVKQYQRNHGLVVDGIVGAQTAASLLGRGSRDPGALPGGLRTRLQKLSTRKMREEDVLTEKLEERTVHTEARQRDNGVKSASHSSIRSAIFDLSDRTTPTHTVKLPNGTEVKVEAASFPSYGSYGRQFSVTNGKETLTATGVEEAADTAKELDSRQPGASGTPVAGATG